jgi:glycerophosphoryl diester phosphodiesterase
MSSLRGRIGAIVRFAMLFESFRLLVLAPLGAGLLRLALARWGRCSVGNFEIIAFLLSPPGLAALIGVGTVGLTTFYIEIAGLILLLADRHATWWGIFPAIGKRFLLVFGLGLRQFVILIMLAAPFLGAGGAVLKVLWAGRDLNGLIVLKPPVFWIGAAVGACLGATYALIGGYLLLRWLLALPAVLFEPGTSGGKAMGLSTRRTRGRLVGILGFVIAWLVTVILVSSVLMGGLRFGSGWLLDRVGLSLTVLFPVTAAVLILHTLTAAMLSVFSTAGFASLVLVLYRKATGLPLPNQEPLQPGAGILARLPARWLIVGLAATLVGAVGLVCCAMLANVRLHEHLEITAHRGGAAAAPENTVAAIRKAIEARADWAEIDVQRTADGAIVVLHDFDLVRVGGVRRRVADSTLEQIQSIDVGSRFGGAFQGERIPTLDELIAAAGGGIRLNIELKPNGPNDVAPLVRVVVDSVKRAGITHRCRLCSQSYESLELARQIEPGIQVGFIAGGQLGDLSRLDVNFLMVTERLATRKLVETGGVRGVKVHAWTINDPQLLVPLLDRGVANIITDDPAAMRSRLEEVQELGVAERLLLRVRNLLAD